MNIGLNGYIVFARVTDPCLTDLCLTDPCLVVFTTVYLGYVCLTVVSLGYVYLMGAFLRRSIHPYFLLLSHLPRNAGKSFHTTEHG